MSLKTEHWKSATVFDHGVVVVVVYDDNEIPIAMGKGKDGQEAHQKCIDALKNGKE